jgi:hypothetical protein
MIEPGSLSDVAAKKGTPSSYQIMDRQNVSSVTEIKQTFDRPFSEVISYMTVKISCEYPDGTKGSGTGFFYRFVEKPPNWVLALVTNWHVVEGAREGKLVLHQCDADGNPILGQPVAFSVPDFGEAWMRHPDPNVDLCILPISDMLRTGRERGYQPFVQAVQSYEKADADFLINRRALDDVVMVGYPIGLRDEVNNMPVIRRGATATHPFIDYEGRPEFLIDIACFPGSSGSPVFSYERHLWVTEQEQIAYALSAKFIGVLYAGFVHTQEGDVRTMNIPTQSRTVAAYEVPIGLGRVIKHTQLDAFEPLLEEAMRTGRPWYDMRDDRTTAIRSPKETA